MNRSEAVVIRPDLKDSILARRTLHQKKTIRAGGILGRTLTLGPAVGKSSH